MKVKNHLVAKGKQMRCSFTYFDISFFVRKRLGGLTLEIYTQHVTFETLFKYTSNMNVIL